MNIEIREMRQGEEYLAWKTGRACFSPVERCVFKKPKHAFLAISDGQIVGMASYQILSAKKNQMIGYVETGYVKTGCEGRGIGGALYRRVTDYLKERGCDTVTATVKDDNVASWKLFENNGFHIVGFIQIFQHYGLIGSLRLWFMSTLAVATGFHLWSTAPFRSSSSIRQFGIFAFLNHLILIPFLAFGGNAAGFGPSVAATALLFMGSVLGGLIATLFSKEKWSFRAARGGVLISVVVTLAGGIWPIAGRFYPIEYKRTASFRRSMGLEGLFEWAAILLLIGAAVAHKDQSAIWANMISPGLNLLFFHSLPFYPFECFGGGRIWDYHAGVSAVTMIVSAALLLL